VSYGGGARDTTRLAASSAELWTDLFLLNQAEVVQAVRGAEAELAGLRELIEAGDRAALQAFLERAAVFRRGIDR
jgi:prephenate dehydrogenase